MMPPGKVDVSICVPVFNEEENLPVLVESIDAVFKGLPQSFEVVFADDASSDKSWDVIQRLKLKYPFIRAVRLNRNSGESAAEEAAMKAARGAVFMTMDADMQNDPCDIPDFMTAIKDADAVCGTRVGRRRDPFIRLVSSKIANWVRNTLSGESISDAGCTYRAFKRECFEKIRMYDGMHRFLPTLFRIEGFRVVEIPVSHNERKFGASKYGVWNRLFKSFYDLIAVRWMKKKHLNYKIVERMD